VVTKDTVSGLVSDLDQCIATWRTSRTDSPWGDKAGNLGLNIVKPMSLPSPKGPTYARLTDGDLIKALAAGEHYNALVTPGRSVGDVLAPEMPFEQSQKFAATVESVARDWLAKATVDPKPRLGSYLSTGSRLEPGSADRMRAYVTVCYAESDKPPCLNQGAIAFTVDLPTGATDDFKLIRDIRDQDGTYHFPLER
jgi:hypothetical protein